MQQDNKYTDNKWQEMENQYPTCQKWKSIGNK